MYIGVIDPAESKSGLVFELGLLLHCHFDYFWSKLGKNPKKLWVRLSVITALGLSGLYEVVSL